MCSFIFRIPQCISPQFPQLQSGIRNMNDPIENSVKKYPKIILFFVVYFQIMLLEFQLKCPIFCSILKQNQIRYEANKNTYSLGFALLNKYMKFIMQSLEPKIFNEKV